MPETHYQDHHGTDFGSQSTALTNDEERSAVRQNLIVEKLDAPKETFRELPVGPASGTGRGVLNAVALFAFGTLLVSMVLGSGFITMAVGAILVAALLASRRWGFAAIAVITIIAILFGTLRVARNGPAIVEIPTQPAIPGSAGSPR